MGNFLSLQQFVILLIIAMAVVCSLFLFNWRKSAQRTAELERNLQWLVNSTSDAIVITDQDGQIVQWNKKASTLFGYSETDWRNMNVKALVPSSYRNVLPLKEEPLLEKDPKLETPSFELSGLTKSGRKFPVNMSFGKWQAGKEGLWASRIRDLTELKKSEKKITELVFNDSLTGLPNRRYFSDFLKKAAKKAMEKKETFALLYIDIDHYKLVNDTLGHSAGDTLMVQVAERLQKSLPAYGNIFHLGGDEFAVVLLGSSRRDAQDYARSILQCMKEPFRAEPEELFITASIGISMYPADGTKPESLINNGANAMYRVKQEGKNNFQFFKKEINDDISRKAKIAIDLRKALKKKEFTLHYQPQIDLATGTLTGVEALVRWHHPKLGPISPGEFIPIAEETGIIIPIGEFVLREACRQNKQWQASGLPPFRVAVNISARQFYSNLPETVSRALNDSGLEPQFLELELTESIIQGSPSAVATMFDLKAMGIHLSLDDFGTGYSSLSYLKSFPIDALKIDQYFTRNIHVDLKDAALVDTIIKMAHSLELSVIAEGVETEDQLDFLRLKQCNQAQGYYFKRPVPPQEIEEFYLNVQ